METLSELCSISRFNSGTYADQLHSEKVPMSTVTKASYAVLAACTIAHFLNHVYSSLISPFSTTIRAEMGLTLTQIGTVASAVILAMTITHLIVGYLGDKGWRNVFVPASVLLSSVVVVVSAFASTYIFLIIAMALLGVTASGYHPTVFPTLAERFPKNARAKATGVQAIGGLIGMAIIPILGAFLLLVLGGWEVSFLVLGIIGLALSIPVFGLFRYARTEDTRTVQVLQDIETGEDGWTLNYWLSLTLMGLRGMPFRCTALLFPLYFEDIYGFEPIWAGSLTTILLTAGLVGEMVAAPLSDRVGKRVPFLIASTGVVAPLMLLLNLSLTPQILVLVLIVMGFFFYLGVPPNTAFQTEVSPRQSQGLAFGLLFSIGAVPGALSPIIFGWIGDTWGLPFSILYLVVTLFLATLVAALLKEPKERQIETPLVLDPIISPRVQSSDA
ncbi:MAG: MFS transporter [Candidatus Thorarchaeota archaeon]|nr:MFS transporter [Candidatus Thorarchaeota archaeon]